MSVDGLFAALCSWRTVAVQLARMPDNEARKEADAVRRNIPQELRSAERGVPAEWIADAIRVRRTCETAARTLIALPASAPSLRLLADQTAKALAGISDALNGLALLVTAFARPPHRRSSVQIRVPDWLPSLVNAGRAFVAIGTVEPFWIMTEWPNGAFAHYLHRDRGSPVGAASRPGLRGHRGFYNRHRPRKSHLQCCRGLRPSRPSASPLVFT
jgi:Fusaric acid resistance protein family